MAGTQNDAIWLVKSGDKILGPFTTGEVTTGLLAKDFVVIDEVTSPLSRWRYIREEPAFAKAVEEIRAGLLSAREDTEVQGATTTLTLTATMTSTDVTATAFSVTKANASQMKMPLDLGAVKDAEFIDLPSPLSHSSVKSYGYGEDRNFRQAARASAGRSYLVWGALTIGVVLGVAFLVTKNGPGGGYAGGRAKPTAEDLPSLLSAANTAYRFGDFEEAGKVYRQAASLKPGVPEVVLRQAILKIAHEGQTVEGKREIQGLLQEESLSGAARADARAALGLAEILGEDYKSAFLTLEAASKDAPEHEATWFNLGATAYLLKSIDQASKQFRQLKARADSSAAALMLARTLALKGQNVDFQSAAESLETALVKPDYQQEAFVLGAYYDLQGGNRKRALLRIRSALDIDPYQTDEHFHDPIQYRGEISWKSLLPFCEELNARLKTGSARAMLGICLTKAGRAAEAQKLLTDAVSVAPDAAAIALLHSATAYVLVSLGRDEDARGALRLAMKGNGPRLALILSGRDCAARGEYECATAAWRKIAEEPPLVPSALTGLAGLALKENRSSDAERQLNVVLAHAPSYVPAQKLMAKVEKEMAAR